MIQVVLVVGLVAVIVVVVVAAVWSVMLGRNDDSDETAMRSGGRGRDRRGADDQRWRDRDPRARRPADAAARTSRGDSGSARDRTSRDRTSRDGGRDSDRTSRDGGRDYRDDRRSGRGQAGRSADGDYVSRRPRGYAPDPAETGPATGPNRRPGRAGSGQGRTSADRSAAAGRGRYPTGPQSRAAGTSPRIPAADYPSAEYPSMEFPSSEFPSAEYSSTEFPAADYPAAEYPSGQFPAGDYPSTEFPSAQYPSVTGPGAGNEFPSEEIPAARASARQGARAGAADPDRPDPRRKDSKPRPPAKAKPRAQRGKRDDDSSEDWPSTEWDKLSDEQYWAELSADKPLAATTAGDEPKPARGQSNGSRAEAARSSSRKDSGRSGAAKAASSRSASAAAEDTGGAVSDRDASSRRPSRASSRDAVTERLPVRSSRQPRERSAPPAVPAARRPEGSGRRAAAAPSVTDPSLAMLASLGGAPGIQPPADDDDPLTSPSFSRKTVPVLDSRSYSSGKKGAATGPLPAYQGGSQLPPPGSAAGAGYHDANAPAPAGYSPTGDYQSQPGYPAPYDRSTGADPSGEWYGGEPAVPAVGNPYGSAYPEPAPPAYPSPSDYGVSGDGYASYTSEQLPGYAAPTGYGPQPTAAPGAAYPYQPTSSPDQQLAGGGQFPPAEQAGPYRDQSGADPYSGYGPEGYPPAYARGYPDPYQPEGYRYPPQG